MNTDETKIEDWTVTGRGDDTRAVRGEGLATLLISDGHSAMENTTRGFVRIPRAVLQEFSARRRAPTAQRPWSVS
jgi:hypothetical protein